jgi:hypothetical protein
MSIYERSLQLTESLAILESGKSGAKVVSVLVTRSRDITSDSESLKRVVQSVLALRQHGIEVPIESAFLRQSVLAWEQLCISQENDSHYIASAEGLDVYRHQQRLLKSLTAKLSEACRSSWDMTYHTWIPTVDDNLLEIMEKIPRFSNAVRSIELIRSTMKLYSTVPRTANEVSTFKEKCRELRLCWDQLQAYELHDDVRELFSQLGTTKRPVPLSLLTNHVMQWIQEEGLSDSFYVST